LTRESERLRAFVALTAACLFCGLPAAAAAKTPRGPAGAVISDSPLKKKLWLSGTGRAFKVEYVTRDPFGERAPSTGAVFLPKGKAPRGGWPVVSWAHGTSGLADRCAPSRVGPALPERDRPYLARWIDEGYAIVASDYVGLGTPGLAPYLDGRTTAHNVVDMVKAGRAVAADRGGRRARLARDWVAIGQSQGGGAAIYTARYATEFGGPGLRYRGAVGTGTPAYVEKVMNLVGPNVPPAPITNGLTAYLSYLFAALRYVYPELGIDGILTESGRKYLALAEKLCVFDFEEQLDGVSADDYFTRAPATLPGYREAVDDYMKMPERGFDRPFFMGHGLTDLDVPIALTLPYAVALETNGEPVTFKTYPADHSGTLIRSQTDTIPFVRRLFQDRD
jgi:hypothetical protein